LVAEQWRKSFNKRVTMIAESDANCSWKQAHIGAFESCVTGYIFRTYPVRGSNDRCQHCSNFKRDDSAFLLPYGGEDTGRAWIHSEWWPPWYEDRRAIAEAVLKAMGISGIEAAQEDLGTPGIATGPTLSTD
jgi:hypothetical protein